MDGIQSYSSVPHPQPQSSGPRPIVAAVHGPSAHPGGNASAVKLPSDYLQAVRRRIWLVLLVAIPIASGGTLYVLRMPAIYSVAAQITIEPPKTDPAIRGLVGSGEMVVSDSGGAEKYVPSTLALFNSKSFLQRVLADVDKALGLPASTSDGSDPAAEMVGKIKTKIVPQSSTVLVSYEGRDPELITKILTHALTKFVDEAQRKSLIPGVQAQDKASATLKTYGIELEKIDLDLNKLITENKDLGPNGQNLLEAEYEMTKQRWYYEQNQANSTAQGFRLDALKPQTSAAEMNKAQKLAALEERRQGPARRLAKARGASRNANDPAIGYALLEIQEIDQQIVRLQQVSAPTNTAQEDAKQEILSEAYRKANETQEQAKSIVNEMKASTPIYQKYLTKSSDRDLKAKAIATLNEKLSAFKIITETQKAPVEIIDEPTTPTVPIRPNRTIYIALCVVFSLGLGLGLVCLLEHIDHSVKVPEHLTAGLALPLFGVVPRMIRSSRNHRGGHLWTSGTPDSIEADAYRNLRASLLGATDGRQIVTLLITSAKAGEGKSTTALNLAATCARAGERTLLMDVDLRRPSLNGVFPGQDHDHGLVDVLRGDLPWQRTVVQTDLPNLDFLPTGDTRDVPIEVLGSLELRQLLLSLSQNHYDRVILDGPAVLGLADCRMLGRIVDAAVMVVRSGSQEIRSLQRAKAMLEQSQVFIAGLIFNGLCDDLENWSSYGPNPTLDSPSFSQSRGAPRGLDGRGQGGSSANAKASMIAAAPVEV